MKAKLARLKPELVRAATAACDAAAVDLFDHEAVRLAMVQASAKGFMMCRIAAPFGLDLSRTEAAAGVLSWLAEQGIEGRFERRIDLKASTPELASAYDLVISWEPKALVGGH